MVVIPGLGPLRMTRHTVTCASTLQVQCPEPPGSKNGPELLRVACKKLEKNEKERHLACGYRCTTDTDVNVNEKTAKRKACVRQ